MGCGCVIGEAVRIHDAVFVLCIEPGKVIAAQVGEEGLAGVFRGLRDYGAYAGHLRAVVFHNDPAGHVSAVSLLAGELHHIVPVLHCVQSGHGGVLKLKGQALRKVIRYVFGSGDVPVRVELCHRPLGALLVRDGEEGVAEGEENAAHKNYDEDYDDALEGFSVEELFSCHFVASFAPEFAASLDASLAAAFSALGALAFFSLTYPKGWGMQ